MEDKKTDAQLIAHEISRLPSTIGVPVQDVQKALAELTKQADKLTASLEQTGRQVSSETAKLTAAIDHHASGSAKLARAMLWTNVLLVIATFALVAVAILQLHNKTKAPQQHLGQVSSETAPSAVSDEPSR